VSSSCSHNKIHWLITGAEVIVDLTDWRLQNVLESNLDYNTQNFDDYYYHSPRRAAYYTREAISLPISPVMNSEARVYCGSVAVVAHGGQHAESKLQLTQGHT